MSSASSPYPLLPLRLSNSPLLSGGLADDFLSTLVAQGICNPLPNVSFAPTKRPSGPARSVPKAAHGAKTLQDKPLPTIPVPAIPPRQIIGLLDLLEKMDNDVTKEVQRVRENVKEAKAMVAQHRKERNALHDQVRKRREKERRETKGPDDEFWLNA